MDISDVVSEKRILSAILLDMGKAKAYNPIVTDAYISYNRLNEKEVYVAQRDWRLNEQLKEFLSQNWENFMEFVKLSSEAKVASMKHEIDALYKEAFPVD